LLFEDAAHGWLYTNLPMNVGLYQSAASLSALERWQDAVSQNIASSQVPGYKKRTVEFSSIPMGEVAQDSRARIGEGSPSYYPRATYGVSFQNGEVEPTNRDLDVALQSEGFFVIRNTDGTNTYTRGGALQIRADHTLVTTQGCEILTEDGSPVQLNAQNGALTINRDGSLFQGDTPLGHLQIVSFADTSKLMPAAGGSFVPLAGMEPIPVENPDVLQGHIESSNIAPLREMVDLVTIARAYEANQKLIQSRDSALEKALEKLG